VVSVRCYLTGKIVPLFPYVPVSLVERLVDRLYGEIDCAVFTSIYVVGSPTPTGYVGSEEEDTL